MLQRPRMTKLFTAAWLWLGIGGVAAAQMNYRIPTRRSDLEALCGSRTYGIYERGNHCGWASEAFVTSRVRGEEVFVWRYTERITGSVGAEAVVATLLREEVFAREAPFRFRSGVYENRSLAQDPREGERELDRFRQAVSPTRFGFECTVDYRGERKTFPMAWSIDYRATDRRGLARFLTAPAKLRRSYWTAREVMIDGFEQNLTYRLNKTVGQGSELRHHLEVSYGPDLLSREVRDQTGWPVLLQTGTRELRREPPQRARRPVRRGLFTSALIRSRDPLEKAARGRKLRLRILGPGAASFGKGPGQRVRKIPGGVEVEVDFRSGPKPTPTPWERRQALEETIEIPSGDPTIRRLAKEAVRQVVHPRARVSLLARFVHARLRYSMQRDAFSVLRTLELGEGDCTEFAALFTALARALGIPCRRVTGLAYMGDAEQTFGWHAWCEVAVEGSWLPVDPCWNAFPPPLTHVRLADEFAFSPLPGEIRIELAPPAKPARVQSGPGPTMLPR